MNKFALDQVRKSGWGPWMGAKAAGITGKMGVGGKPAVTPAPAAAPSMGTSMGGYAAGPGAVQERMDTGKPVGLLDDDATASTDLEGIGKMGMDVLKRAQMANASDNFEWLQPQVLKPLRTFTLGKGLLG